LPFHAAEQRRKKRKNDSAEQSDFPKRQLFASSARKPRNAGPNERLPFLLIRFLWANKENELYRKMM